MLLACMGHIVAGLTAKSMYEGLLKRSESTSTCAAPPVGALGVHVAVARAGLQVLHVRDHAHRRPLQLHVAAAVRQHIGLGRTVICIAHSDVSVHCNIIYLHEAGWAEGLERIARQACSYSGCHGHSSVLTERTVEVLTVLGKYAFHVCVM